MNFTREKKNNLKRLIKYGRFFFVDFWCHFVRLYTTQVNTNTEVAPFILQNNNKNCHEILLFRYFVVIFVCSKSSLYHFSWVKDSYTETEVKKKHTFICHLIISVVIQCQYLYYKPNVIWIEPEFVRFAMENETTLGSITTIGSNDWWFYRPLYIK